MQVKITECPRDAMQGVEQWIETDRKIDYINQLLKVGFDVIDFGSFVSPKAIPQLKDTAEVLNGLNIEESDSKLLAIIANKRGATDAASFPQISYVGYPFSISETFQQRNTNASIAESMTRVEEIANIAANSNQRLLIYISMAFGNPYGDAWNPDLACEWVRKLADRFDISDFAMADTVGVANEASISELFTSVMSEFSALQIGAHLHSNPNTSQQKVRAAYDAGCRSFDVAINGLGGCPMAEDDLVGNVSTQALVNEIGQNNVGIDSNELERAIVASNTVFN